MRRVGILAPMRPELRPLLRRLSLREARCRGSALWTGVLGRLEVVAAITGIGMPAAARTAERLLDQAAVDRLVVVGIAGGVARGLHVGDVVVPERVLDLATGAEHRPAPLGPRSGHGTLATSDELIVDREAIAGLERRGIVAIDMETAAIAAVCERRRVAWSVFRAISDRAGGPLDPEILRLGGAEGRPDPLAVVRFLATRPWRVPELVRLGRGTQRATRAAAAAAVAALGAA